MYHKAKCRARLVTRLSSQGDQIHETNSRHTHPNMYTLERQECPSVEKLCDARNPLCSIIRIPKTVDVYLPVDFVVHANGKLASPKQHKLRFIRGQRQTMQLVYNQYAYAKNNEHGATTYWNCRIRRAGLEPCHARLSTTKLPNGKYKICLNRSEHNHMPSKRIMRMLNQTLK
ncbi:uncharacterized protein LOC108602960 [Drosophila busckii]|uniref:uncharacterized protein LOC108602960 n=1 Tax=Drosophila busckii TaxID=30019 RepID=UPI00083F0232|nr:uncharacterized protein LOC108602960 [Drosophila busckii]XP_017846825.1 uncharacterized protein LOC108602960 [Drosophila busckii]